MEGLAKWATSKGVMMENGVSLFPSSSTTDTTDTEDWNIRLLLPPQDSTTPIDLDRRLLFIPREIILNSLKIEESFRHSVPGWKDAMDYIHSRNCGDQVAQYHLWVQILMEWERGTKSEWYPWIQSLPRTFSNALYMDKVELDFLPPYAWSLAKLQLLHLEIFPKALKMMKMDTLSNDILQNHELHKWALSVVFTRCWGVNDDDDDDDNDDEKNPTDDGRNPTDDRKTCHIAPIGDMLNHAEKATTFLEYDTDGNCAFFMKQEMVKKAAMTTTTMATTEQPQQQPLSLSYGRTTNPSRFLVLYGFVDTTQRHIFVQILVTQPTIQHKNMGYNVDRMTLNTEDGTLTDEVWDVTLYSILEQIPKFQEQFYTARQSNDTVTTDILRCQYRLETSVVLKRHMDAKLKELEDLLVRMDQLMMMASSGSVTETTNPIERHTLLEEQHPRFFLIRQHNIFLYQAFAKAQSHLNHDIQQQLELRKRETAAVSG